MVQHGVDKVNSAWCSIREGRPSNTMAQA